MYFNIILVVIEPFKEFITMEPLTYTPLQAKMIDPKLLTEKEVLLYL